MRIALLGPLLLAVALAGCDSKAERAETHYQRALAYLEAGDEERASVEFRNVFRLNPDHAEARLRYASLLRDEGATGDALAQYQKLVDIRPDLAEAHAALAELALEIRDFDTATVNATRAWELDPADPRNRALKATVDFRRGAGAQGGRPAAVAMATGVLADDPGNVMARLVLVSDRLQAKDTAGALAQVEAGLAAAPGDEGLHLARLALLEETGDNAAVGDELAAMNRLFPENAGARAALVQWHLRNGKPDEAEAVLRAAADTPGERPGKRPIPAPPSPSPSSCSRSAAPRRPAPSSPPAPRRRRRRTAPRPVRPTCAPSPASTSPRAGPMRRSPRSATSSPAWRPATRAATPRSPSPRCSPRPARRRRAPPSSRPCSPRTAPMSAR